MNTPKKANYGFCDYLIPFDQEEEKETILVTTMSFTFGFFFLYFLFYKALILTQLVIKKRKKKGRERPTRGPEPRPFAGPLTRGPSLACPPASPRGKEGERRREPAERKRTARKRSRVVSLQKGTNQPATRMSLNRSQRSCRSTKYGTQAKT